MPTPWEAALVLGALPHDRVPAFYRALVVALDASTVQQRVELARGFPGIVIAWTMRQGTEDERQILKHLAYSTT